MPSSFDVTTSTNTLTLDNTRKGVAVFTVKNLTRRNVHATAAVKTDPSGGEKWLTFLPPAVGAGTNAPNVRDIPIDGDTTVQIQIAVPIDAPPGAFKLKLKVADELNPDDNFGESPDVVFTIRETPKSPPRPFPVWIFPAIIIVLLVFAMIIVVAITSSGNANANATAVAAANTAGALETAAALQIDQVTQTSFVTQTAVGTQNALATQAALGVQAALETQNALGTQNALATQDVNNTLTAVMKQETIDAHAAAVAATLKAMQDALKTHQAEVTEQLTEEVIAHMTATQAASNVFVGAWDSDNSGSKITIVLIHLPQSGKTLIQFSSLCSPTTGTCDTKATMYPLENVNYNPQHLVAGVGNTSLSIVPANNGQIAVTYTIAGKSATVTFHRNTNGLPG